MKCIFLFYFVLLAQFIYAQTYNLTVIVTNIKNLKGEIKIGVYNNKASFPHKKDIYKSLTLKVNKPSETFILKDLPKGDYAVALFHDENSDGICNSNFLGIPEEAYGFSKNYKPILSAPSFNNCRINLNDNMQIVIKLIL